MQTEENTQADKEYISNNTAQPAASIDPSQSTLHHQNSHQPKLKPSSNAAHINIVTDRNHANNSIQTVNNLSISEKSVQQGSPLITLNNSTSPQPDPPASGANAGQEK